MAQIFAADRPSRPHSASQRGGQQRHDKRLSGLQDIADDSPAQRKLLALSALSDATPVQRMDSMDDEEALQGKARDGAALQRMEDEEMMQGKSAPGGLEAPVQKQADTASNGLPGPLRSGIESLSGMNMDDVRVHRGSSKPAQVNAHAYAQGTDIHLAAGQDKHLAHEAWHVVQQKQGRVQPTVDLGGVAVNDDASLETEADVMGAKAEQIAPDRSR